MTLLVIIIIALIAIVLFLYFYRRREKSNGYTPYVEAMVALLEGNEPLAMKKFKETVSLDSDLIDAYIRLGDLYRKQGDLNRALQIHQSLTIRPTLKKQEEKRIYYALVNDLLQTSRHNKAISFLKEILKIDKKDKHARELILRINEDMENYADCISIYEESRRRRKDLPRHAFYYASLGQSKLKNMNEEEDNDKKKEALNLLKKALKISANSLSALYYLAQHAEQEGDLKKAKEYYYKILTHHPDHAFLILPQCEKVYFELDSFDDILPIYENIFQKNPKNFSVALNLADIYEKKNDIETAREVYRQLEHVYPKSILPKLRLIKLGTDDEVVHEQTNEIEKLVYHRFYRCNKCGFETKNFSFICPQCHAIEAFSPCL